MKLKEHTVKTLKDLKMKEYFNVFTAGLDSSIDLKFLTDILTDVPYQEKKPYLTRRQLKPYDKRFDNIEIVYNDESDIKAIVWEFQVSLTSLMEWFGTPTYKYEPYSDSTIFFFECNNPSISVIKTRYPNRLLNEDLDLKEYREFSYIQFNIEKTR